MLVVSSHCYFSEIIEHVHDLTGHLSSKILVSVEIDCLILLILLLKKIKATTNHQDHHVDTDIRHDFLFLAILVPRQNFFFTRWFLDSSTCV